MDDFRTLITAGFEFPVISSFPLTQEAFAVVSKTVDPSKQSTGEEDLKGVRQTDHYRAKRVATPNYHLSDQADHSQRSKTPSDFDRPLHADHSCARLAVELSDHRSVCRTEPTESSQELDGTERAVGSGGLSCTSPISHFSAKRAAEFTGNGTSQEPFAVSSYLLDRYNREELYEKVWTMSVRKVAKEYGVAHTVMSRTCKRLHIPVPSAGYLARKAANKSVPAKPPLPAVLGLTCETRGTKPSGPGCSQGSPAVSHSLLARYHREELYEKVWTMPIQMIADEYGVSHSAMVTTCKSLHIPTPGMGYWSKRAANKPVPDKPPLPEILGLISLTGLSETSGTVTVQDFLTVSAGLMSRYDRDELYKKAWDVPMLRLAKEFGVSNEALGKTCRKLHIPIPGRGYWAVKAANLPVDLKPPLPEVQIRVSRSTLKKCPQTVGASMHVSRSEEPDGPSPLKADIPPEPLTVSRILIARYDRQELYERVWSVPLVKLEKEFGISNRALREKFKRLRIPIPGPGYWQKKWANKPVEPRPPLPKVKIR